jgi:DNA polymerase III epsilon subunit
MREIIFDTETTGLDAREDRIIELGCIELDNRFPTGRTFHHYINPQGRAINPEAQAVHGIGAEQLVGKPTFGDLAEKFLAFIDGAKLVAHNAGFDMGFINAEFARLGHPAVGQERVVDTLALARPGMTAEKFEQILARQVPDAQKRRLADFVIDTGHSFDQTRAAVATVIAELLKGAPGGDNGAAPRP